MLVKSRCGEQRKKYHGSYACHAQAVHAGWRANCLKGHLEPFLFCGCREPTPRTRLPGSASRIERYPLPCSLRLLRTLRLGTPRPAPPRKPLLARTEACKVAAAKLTSIRRRAQSYEQASAKRWMVIVLGPGAQLHAETLGAPRIAPRLDIQERGFKAVVAVAASKREHAGDTLYTRRKTSDARAPNVPGTAIWTRTEMHCSRSVTLRPRSDYTRVRGSPRHNF